jgi:hypothetical protein
MSSTLTFAFGTGKKNIFSNCFSAISFDHTTGDQSIKGFKKGTNFKTLLETYLLPFDKIEHDNIEVVFKSQRVAKSFSEKNSALIPTEWKIKSLEGMQILKLQDSKFDENALHAILLELLGSENLNVSVLSKTNKEILEDLVTNIDDALTQSLLVGIAKQPIIYDMSKCFLPLSKKAEAYLNQTKK